MSAGFDGFIEKPVNLKNLLDTVQQAVRKGKAVSAPAKILVVDDTPQNVKLLRDLLEVKGYAVATAANGEEALARLPVENPDLVLLDVMMPGLSGYDVCRRIREDPADRAAAGGAVHLARPAAGAREGHRSGRRRLPQQAGQPGGAASRA